MAAVSACCLAVGVLNCSAGGICVGSVVGVALVYNSECGKLVFCLCVRSVCC